MAAAKISSVGMEGRLFVLVIPSSSYGEKYWNFTYRPVHTHTHTDTDTDTQTHRHTDRHTHTHGDKQ